MKPVQIDLFHVQKAYESAGKPMTNDELYDSVAQLAGIPRAALDERSEVGSAKTPRSKLKRKIRWIQQTLKSLNLLEKVEGERGVWKLAQENKHGLHEALGETRLVGYSTNLGFAVWADSKKLYADLGEQIHLCVTSPPYPLRMPRSYGNVDEAQWVDFICGVLEPIVENLAPGGSLVLNVGQDIFERGRPSRSMHVERMVLALHDRLGLSLMDRWPWINLSKPPGPTYWACVQRKQLCSGWEPIFWFTNDPEKFAQTIDVYCSRIAIVI